MTEIFRQKLKVYYSRLFPFEQVSRWLSYGKEEEEKYFSRREFSFTHQNDIVTRYICFGDSNEFKKKVCEQIPLKFDIGAVFNTYPQNKNSVHKLVPLEKEFVLDIDMTDYDKVRNCCKGSKVCNNCFNLIKVAVRVLDDILRKDFAFKNILWVFSGRRGVHCWIGDKKARKYEDRMRSNVVSYLCALKENKVKVCNGKMHPSFERIYSEILLPNFENVVLEGQQLLSNEKNDHQVLSLLPESLCKMLSEEFKTEDLTPKEKWARIKHESDRATLVSLVFDFVYPKLDVNVSRSLNHLLKSVFAVHPSTGKICIPLDPQKLDSFNVDQVPTLESVLKDLDDWKREDNIEDYKKTSLEEHIQFFKKKFVDPLLFSLSKEENSNQATTDF